MDRVQAENLIKETFEQRFDEKRFTKFIVELLNLKTDQIEDKHPYSGNLIPDSYEEYISTFKRIAKYSDGQNEIDILIVKLKRESSIVRARTVQRNFISWYLNGSRGGKLKDAALVAFVSPDGEDWRFSLVKMEYRFEEAEQGRVKVKHQFTPAKRWSFLVGANEKSHTAQRQLVGILQDDKNNPTLEILEEAFNIETVTKEFFTKYRDLFIRTKKALDDVVRKDPKVRKEFEDKAINTVDFSKKLLGQITFLYFLQKKGWFGVKRNKEWGSGSKNFLRELFDKKHCSYNNFFNDILEPLFYEALSKKRDDNYYSRFDCKIPFLNGGLFDPINGYDWVNTEITLKDELFSNQNRTNEGDIGDGIFDVFDRYNFTVREDEPLEKEVAIDPELLGKAYEKFNAIRPDNFDEYINSIKTGKESQFNKEYGVYYTPREIVHFICQKSLECYLKEELKEIIPEKDIEDFIQKADSVLENELAYKKKSKQIENGEIKRTSYTSELPPSILQNLETIDKKLEEVTICDPAVGSGAFPVGMMTEIIKLRSAIHILLTGNIPLLYEMKKTCLEKSIYGVDIDEGAIEIARLRMWLSLIVDEEDIKNIKPLPNLDYKLVKGDSLIGLPYEPEWYAEVEKKKLQYLEESDTTKKAELKREIDSKLEQQLKSSSSSYGYKIDFDFKLFFSEVFHQKGGFDIVIGNPPYRQLQKNGGYLANLYQNQNYKTFQRTGDIYCLFYEKGINILRDGGHLAFITSNKWMRAGYGKELRQFFVRYNPKILIDLGPNVFENATVDTNIILVKKSRNENKLKAVTINEKKKDNLNLSAIIQEEGLLLHNLSSEPWFIGDEAEQKLKEKIERIGKPLKDWDVNIYYGIKTGLNDAFIITTERRNEILDNCKDEAERRRTEAIIKPILRGRDIKRYYYEWAGLWVIIAKFGFYKESYLYPAIVNHLKKYEIELKSRGQCRYTRQNKAQSNKDYPGQHHWLELDNNPQDSYLREFEKEKVVYSETIKIYFDGSRNYPRFVFDENKNFLDKTIFFITGRIWLKYLLGYLNSNVSEYLMENGYCNKLGSASRGLQKNLIENIPVPEITPATKPIVHQIESLVDKILSAKKENPQADTSQFETQIDHLVYKLYNLSEEEIKIVEGKK
jgi:hypothetical protein